MSISTATSLVEVATLAFTAFAILLKIMSESPSAYPDRAIRRVAIAAGIMLIGGLISTVYLAASVPGPLLLAAIVCISLAFVVGLISLYPMAQAEKAEQDDQENLDV